METEDPRESIKAADIKTRSAAARDLARIGTWDDIEALVNLANHDKSSAVKLYAAAAAADIAARYRKTLTADQKEAIHRWMKGADPSANPGLLMMYSAVADDAAVERLGRMLRDPRNEVRLGATTAVRRMALSAHSQAHPKLSGALVQWMTGGRVPPDVSLELLRLAGEIGWTGLEGAIRAASSAGRPHAQASEAASAQLMSRDDPRTWEGMWVDDGLDVLEVGQSPGRTWVIISNGRWMSPEVNQPFVVSLQEGHLETTRVRLIFAPPVGAPEQRVPAIQYEGRTAWRVEGKDLVAAVEEMFHSFGEADLPALRALVPWLEAIEGTLATRSRALIAWKLGDLPRARALLEELAGHKKPRPDVWYWLARVAADQGDKAKAMEAVDAFLEKVGKRAEYRKEAEELKETLGR